MTKIYITKYALTQGILEREAEINSRSNIAIVPPTNKTRLDQRINPRDYTLTREDAEKMAEDMRQRKIASLEKQLAKLHDMSFKE